MFLWLLSSWDAREFSLASDWIKPCETVVSNAVADAMSSN